MELQLAVQSSLWFRNRPSRLWPQESQGALNSLPGTSPPQGSEIIITVTSFLQWPLETHPSFQKQRGQLREEKIQTANKQMKNSSTSAVIKERQIKKRPAAGWRYRTGRTAEAITHTAEGCSLLVRHIIQQPEDAFIKSLWFLYRLFIYF